jgi:opacity protein-like surface antigen
MALALVGGAASAQELSWSAYGTLGYAQSDRPFTYQRHISDEGGFARDTRLGLQADLRFSPQWWATAQAKLEPATNKDNVWALSAAWAFIGWRPDDDWLLRVGRLRLPMYLHSESMDVGQTHDMVRLPAELYSIVPTPDFDGASVSRSWALGDQGQRELTADLFGGSARLNARLAYRDGLPPAVPAGPNFVKVKIDAIGLAVSLREPGLVARTSLSTTAMHRVDGSPVPTRFPYVALGPGLGYYQVSAALPGPGVSARDRVHNTLFSVGAEAELGGGWRVASEFVRNVQHDTPFGADATAGYVAVFRRLGAFTPYVSLAAQRSRDATFDWYERLTNRPLPALVPGADLINAAQRVAAESYWATSQRSLALGTSYALTPQVKLKAEWLHTRIGRVSRLVDTPAGEATPQHTGVNVLSFNLNFAY